MTGFRDDWPPLQGARGARVDWRLEAIFEHAPVGISISNVAGRYLDVNPRMCDITGYTASELKTKSFRDITHPDDLGRDDDALMQLLKGEISRHSAEKRYVRKDGRLAWVNLSMSAVRSESGAMDQLITIVEDTTNRHEAVDNMRALARIPDENPNAVMRIGFDGRILYANSASALLQLVCGTGVGGLVNEHCLRLIEESARSDQPVRLEQSIAERTIEVSVVPISSDGYCNVYGVDVTAQRQAEAALARRERFYRKLIEGGSDTYAVIDRSGKVIYSSESSSTMPPVREVIGEQFKAFVHPSSQIDADRTFAKVLTEPGEPIRAEIRSVLPNGEVVQIEAISRNLTDDPDVGGIVVAARDITARRKAEDALLRSLEGTISAISATMESQDPYTAGHQHRVAMLASAIAGELRLDAATVKGIYFGAMIHDIGKIQVPAQILVKPGKLTPLEYALVKEHAKAGFEIVKSVEFPWPVREMILQHHERLDGSGYPDGLRGDQICLEARIVAIADIVESMSTHRPYRPALGVDAALAEIERLRGAGLDARAVDACVTLFREQRFSLT